MTPEESRIIRDVFERLRSMGPARDVEAQSAVEAELRANPSAALGLVQAVVTLDRERQALEQRVMELEQAMQQPQAPQQGGLFGGASPSPWGSRAPQPASVGPAGVPNVPQQQGWQNTAPQGQGYGYQQPAPQQPAPQQQRGGGLFSTVLGAAGGLAAGYFGAQALGSLFGGHGNGGGGLFGSGSGAQDDGVEIFPRAGERTAADDNAFFNDSGSGFADFGGGNDDSFA